MHEWLTRNRMGRDAADVTSIRSSAYIDSEGRIVLPVMIKGTPPKIIVLPNLEKLMQTGAKRVLQKTADDLLQRALGGKQKTAPPQGAGQLKGILGF